MLIYHATASSDVRVRSAIGIIERLAAFGETADLAPELQEVTDRLERSAREREAKERALSRAMAGVAVAEYLVDQETRSLARAAEIADGGRRGQVFHEVFPDGLTPEVKPGGRAQVDATRALLDRVRRSTLPALEGPKARGVGALQEAFDRMAAKVAAHDAARAEYDEAFGAEVGLRKEHLLAIDRVAGRVRAAFPRDREKQNLFFPSLRRSGRPATEPLEIATS